MASLNFDATTVAPSESYTPLPAGTYLAQVTESEVRPTKSGSGQLLALTWTVLDGQYVNRRIFDRINVANQNKVAEEIGQRQLSQLCHAVGVLKLTDSNQLHGKPVSIKLAVKKDEQYGDSNEVKGYSATNNVAPQATNVAASATPPWARK